VRQDHDEVKKVEDVSENTEANINLEKPSCVLDILKENPLNIKFHPLVHLIEPNASVLLEFKSLNKIMGIWKLSMNQKPCNSSEKVREE